MNVQRTALVSCQGLSRLPATYREHRLKPEDEVTHLLAVVLSLSSHILLFSMFQVKRNLLAMGRSSLSVGGS